MRDCKQNNQSMELAIDLGLNEPNTWKLEHGANIKSKYAKLETTNVHSVHTMETSQNDKITKSQKEMTLFCQHQMVKMQIFSENEFKMTNCFVLKIGIFSVFQSLSISKSTL